MGGQPKIPEIRKVNAGIDVIFRPQLVQKWSPTNEEPKAGEEYNVYTKVSEPKGDRKTDTQMSVFISDGLVNPKKPTIRVMNGVLELEWEKEPNEDDEDGDELLDGFVGVARRGNVTNNIVRG